MQQQLDKYLGFLAQDENNLALLLDIIALYIQNNELSKAAEYLERAKKIQPETCLEPEGILHLKQGNPAKAIACFRQALTIQETPYLQYFLALSLSINQEFNEALPILESLSEENDPEIVLLQAQIHHNLHNLEKALHLLEKNLEHYPEHAKTLGLLALIQFDSGEEEIAAHYAALSLAIDPSIYEAQVVDILLKTAKGETSTQDINALIQTNPHDPRLWFTKGNIHTLQYEWVEAQKALEKALELHPDFYECHMIAGWCYLMQENLEKAEYHYLFATNISPEIAEGWGGLGLIAALQEDFIQAGHYIEKSLELDEDCYLSELAQAIYYLQDSPQQAAEHGQKVLESGIKSIKENIQRAALLLESHDTTIH